jgi:hypothetical protein
MWLHNHRNRYGILIIISLHHIQQAGWKWSPEDCLQTKQLKQPADIKGSHLEEAAPSRQDPASAAFQLFVSTTFNHIKMVLSKHKIMSAGLLLKRSKLPWIMGTYSILCESGRVHIEQTRYSTETTAKKHHWHIYLYHPEEPGVTNTALPCHLPFENSPLQGNCSYWFNHSSSPYPIFPQLYYF